MIDRRHHTLFFIHSYTNHKIPSEGDIIHSEFPTPGFDPNMLASVLIWTRGALGCMFGSTSSTWTYFFCVHCAGRGNFRCWNTSQERNMRLVLLGTWKWGAALHGAFLAFVYVRWRLWLSTTQRRTITEKSLVFYIELSENDLMYVFLSSSRILSAGNISSKKKRGRLHDIDHDDSETSALQRDNAKPRNNNWKIKRLLRNHSSFETDNISWKHVSAEFLICWRAPSSSCLKQVELPFNIKHPVILPSPVTT